MGSCPRPSLGARCRAAAHASHRNLLLAGISGLCRGRHVDGCRGVCFGAFARPTPETADIERERKGAHDRRCGRAQGVDRDLRARGLDPGRSHERSPNNSWLAMPWAHTCAMSSASCRAIARDRCKAAGASFRELRGGRCVAALCCGLGSAAGPPRLDCARLARVSGITGRHCRAGGRRRRVRRRTARHVLGSACDGGNDWRWRAHQLVLTWPPRLNWSMMCSSAGGPRLMTRSSRAHGAADTACPPGCTPNAS